MPDCIFCEIVARRLPASIVYEDESTLAFMDRIQANPGHVLVIPKPHVEAIDHLPPVLAGQVFQTVAHVARAVKAAFSPDGLTIWQANGAAAGQTVFHLHVHILPRRDGDHLIHIAAEALHHQSPTGLAELAERIKGQLAGLPQVTGGDNGA